MKIFNAIMAFVFIAVPAAPFWIDCWTNSISPQEKYENAMTNLGLEELSKDVNTHAELIEAFNNKQISRNEYVREMEKLKKKLEREAKQAERKVKRELK